MPGVRFDALALQTQPSKKWDEGGFPVICAVPLGFQNFHQAREGEGRPRISENLECKQGQLYTHQLPQRKQSITL